MMLVDYFYLRDKAVGKASQGLSSNHRQLLEALITQQEALYVYVYVCMYV